MIIVKLIGGLGNQMFQYAIGKALSYKKGTPFYLDSEGFKKYKLHNYSLHHFNIQNKFIKRPFLIKILIKLKLIKHITETKSLSFNSSIQSEKGHIYLDGYWQSEKYFLDIRNELIKDFELKSKVSEQTESMAIKMADENSVSIHIRRGDYISNQKTLQIHGICDLDYYKNAINEIEKKQKIDSYYIFSDDHRWVKENINFISSAVYVTHNDASRNYEDLYLMSQCKHNIIANSSFSWWGAWLNNNNEKVVIAPKKWFNDSKRKSEDIIPDNWIKI